MLLKWCKVCTKTCIAYLELSKLNLSFQMDWWKYSNEWNVNIKNGIKHRKLKSSYLSHQATWSQPVMYLLNKLYPMVENRLYTRTGVLIHKQHGWWPICTSIKSHYTFHRYSLPLRSVAHPNV